MDKKQRVVLLLNGTSERIPQDRKECAVGWYIY
jgi:hypothetical protein